MARAIRELENNKKYYVTELQHDAGLYCVTDLYHVTELNHTAGLYHVRHGCCITGLYYKTNLCHTSYKY